MLEPWPPPYRLPPGRGQPALSTANPGGLNHLPLVQANRPGAVLLEQNAYLPFCVVSPRWWRNRRDVRLLGESALDLSGVLFATTLSFAAGVGDGFASEIVMGVGDGFASGVLFAMASSFPAGAGDGFASEIVTGVGDGFASEIVKVTSAKAGV